MSNYLAVVAVSEYEVVVADKDPRHQILVKPGTEVTASYATDIVVDSLSFFEEYHDIKYPLPKLGHIAVEDFGGAMENYGLIVYE